MPLKVLLLTRAEVEKVINMKETIKVVEEAFKEKGLGLVDMPPKTYIFFPKYDGDFRVMPAYLKGMDIAGVKVVNVHPKNPRTHNLPTVMATIVLLDPKTGAPLSIMDGTLITAYRTGAAGGIAAKYLARKESEVVAIIGAGVQGRMQLMALTEVMENIKEVRVYDIRKEASVEYAKEMSEKLGLNVRASESAKDAVADADIIVTATPSREPIVMNEWLKQGVHINAIGADAPGKEELDPMILKRAKIVVDDYEQASHSGEINVPLSKGVISMKDIYAELGEIVSGKKPGRTNDLEITVFDSTGLAIQDVATAWMVYNKAKERELGTWIELF
mgnify:CR=1 FL=1